MQAGVFLQIAPQPEVAARRGMCSVTCAALAVTATECGPVCQSVGLHGTFHKDAIETRCYSNYAPRASGRVFYIGPRPLMTLSEPARTARPPAFGASAIQTTRHDPIHPPIQSPPTPVLHPPPRTADATVHGCPLNVACLSCTVQSRSMDLPLDDGLQVCPPPRTCARAHTHILNSAIAPRSVHHGCATGRAGGELRASNEAWSLRAAHCTGSMHA